LNLKRIIDYDWSISYGLRFSIYCKPGIRGDLLKRRSNSDDVDNTDFSVSN